MTPLPQESIAGLLNDGHKPIFLLGAGASVGSGVPLAGQLVESIAKFAYCKETARVFDDPTLMRSDWYGWLEQRPWFSRSVPPADLYPTAVEALLQPSSVRKEFFQSILHRALEPSAGYQRLVSLMAKRSITTVLTTNFDDLIAQTVKSTRAVGHCDEIKTPSDFAMFDTASSVPQVAFPGFDVVFRSELVVHEASNVVLHEQQLEKALGLKPYDGLEAMVNVYASAINRAKEDFRPDVVACVVPEPVERKFWSVSRMLSRMERDALKRTATATASLQMQLPFDWEVEEQSEDLLTRDFRRALKARAMQIGVPIQLLRNSGMIDLRTNEEPAARAWNLSVGLYYKAGGIPWRVRNRGPETCFVGITFHHLRTTKRALVHSALAQAFSTNGGGFALRGQSFEPERDASTRTPHLTEQQADELGKLVIDEYTARNGELPKRIVLHKSSRFWRQEQEGFLKAFREVPVVKLVALAPSSVRFVTQGVYWRLLLR